MAVRDRSTSAHAALFEQKTGYLGCPRLCEAGLRLPRRDPKISRDGLGLLTASEPPGRLQTHPLSFLLLLGRHSPPPCAYRMKVVLQQRGVIARVMQRILALTAAIWHNDHAGQDVLRSLTAFDH